MQLIPSLLPPHLHQYWFTDLQWVALWCFWTFFSCLSHPNCLNGFYVSVWSRRWQVLLWRGEKRNLSATLSQFLNLILVLPQNMKWQIMWLPSELTFLSLPAVFNELLIIIIYFTIKCQRIESLLLQGILAKKTINLSTTQVPSKACRLTSVLTYRTRITRPTKNHFNRNKLKIWNKK